MKLKTSVVLSIMMFLQYYVWGSWYVTMGTFMTKVLNATGIQIGSSQCTCNINYDISFLRGHDRPVLYRPRG